MKDKLIEILTTLFKNDNASIDAIISKFDYEEKDYTRPPENIEQFVDDLLYQNQSEDVNCEFTDAFIHTESIVSNGLNLNKGDIEFWFKFNDVKLKRKKIFRLGDYYLRLVNTGFDKWDFLFYIEAPEIIENKLVDSFILAAHPHISIGRACLAGMETGIRASITNYNFNGFLWKIRLFLSSWNYRSPHHNPEAFEYKKVLQFNPTDRLKMFNVRKNSYEKVFSAKSYQLSSLENIDYTLTNHMLTSARKKEYNKNPLSRLMYHMNNNIKYISGENIQNARINRGYVIVQAISDWIKEMHAEADWTNEVLENYLTENQYLVIANYFYNTLFNKCKENANRSLNGEWSNTYDDMQVLFNKTIETCKHFRHRNFVNPGKYGSYNDSYVWYLNNEDDNPDSWSLCDKLMIELRGIIEEVRRIKNRVLHNEGPQLNDIYNSFYFELTEIFKNLKEVKFENNYSQIIEFINNYTVEQLIEEETLETKMENYELRHLEIDHQLSLEYNKQITIYHENELRRLNGNRTYNTVSIENLNL